MIEKFRLEIESATKPLLLKTDETVAFLGQGIAAWVRFLALLRAGDPGPEKRGEWLKTIKLLWDEGNGSGEPIVLRVPPLKGLITSSGEVIKWRVKDVTTSAMNPRYDIIVWYRQEGGIVKIKEQENYRACPVEEIATLELRTEGRYILYEWHPDGWPRECDWEPEIRWPRECDWEPERSHPSLTTEKRILGELTGVIPRQWPL
ncbi:MAG: hypothetical protein WC768_03150 [Patescibacteria group bacterium]|jgi:hypothetical protein